MNLIHDDLERKDFEKFSPIVEQRTYCTETGLLASDGCTSRATGWYSKENLPGTCTASHASSAPATEDNSGGDQEQVTPGETTTAATETQPAAETTQPPATTDSAA